MKDFAKLISKLDETTKTNVRVNALADFFNSAKDEDKVWTIALLSGRRPKRAVKTNMIRTWASEEANIPYWLFEESYHIVGDLAETIALLLPEPIRKSHKSLSQRLTDLIQIREKEEADKKEYLKKTWSELNREERFVFNKLLTGGFRIGISQKLMTKALAKSTGINENSLALRLMGDWDPAKKSYQKLIIEPDPNEDLNKPYPFYLAYPLENEINKLGNTSEWLAERKWDGIRGQIVYRKGEMAVWSRGEELVTEKYPEFKELKKSNGDFVLDGEILAFKDKKPLPFQSLQTRIGRKNISKIMLEKTPVVFMAYDLLELSGMDLRSEAIVIRRSKLEQIIDDIDHDNFKLSPLVEFNSWEELKSERKRSRELHCEGLMLKRKESIYETGRKKGSWWKWKIDPLTIDAVLIYAMRGHGRRANLYTDYTFAVRDGENLVPFTKAYSGLSDQEFREVDAFVKKNTLERFGPVRSVKPELVFEIAFEGIAESKRHKSGIALRFPRMKRWRKDKSPNETNTLEDLINLLNLY
ncbi:ATP-dependent DNA ligase [Hyphobacterium sp. CCMP332]|nr:ATP-dependent DNA ligase [Hyphobacterium sp. CCMP332]